LGTQGSGKGTQVELLNKKMNLPVLTMGDVFRAEAKQPTKRGQKIKSILDEGDIVPAELWEPVLRNYLKDFNASDGALLDGVVRSPQQVTAFDQIRKELSLPEPYVVAISLSEEKAIPRLLKRGRHDDTESQIRERFTTS